METLYTCKHCNRKLPHDDFMPDKRRKTGIVLICRTCYNDQRATRRKSIKFAPVMDGDKRCSGCKTVKPVIEFSRNPKQPDGRSNWCKDCAKADKEKRKAADPEYYKELSKRKTRKLRMEVLTHYSSDPPHCACCGESHIEFLALDHIDGNGNKHRKTIPSGSYIYQWIRNNKFPPGFQVLCHNCNMAKGFYGYCPHQKET